MMGQPNLDFVILMIAYMLLIQYFIYKLTASKLFSIIWNMIVTVFIIFEIKNQSFYFYSFNQHIKMIKF